MLLQAGYIGFRVWNLKFVAICETIPAFRGGKDVAGGP